jgi:hypothetical protein
MIDVITNPLEEPDGSVRASYISGAKADRGAAI